ncbi:MAG: hypothetical protein OEL66_10425, partial [Desulfobulbaceae bacterium]|nr:hypothetical protein [Desulfobulbaceae bacterium]
MSSRISTFVLLAILTLFVGGCDDAPLPPPKPPVKIAIVNCGQRFYPLIKMFKQRLSDLDHLEGRDVIFLYDGPIATDQLREKLQYLKTQDIGLLFTITTPVTRVAHEIFKDTNVPIVFGPVFSPVDDGLTSSLTRPDKNMTGVMIRGNTARAFGFLIESMPSLKSLSVPFPCNESTSRLSIEDLREVAEKHDVTVVTTNIKTEADLNDYLLHLPKETEAIWLPHSPFIMNH